MKLSELRRASEWGEWGEGRREGSTTSPLELGATVSGRTNAGTSARARARSSGSELKSQKEAQRAGTLAPDSASSAPQPRPQFAGQGTGNRDKQSAVCSEYPIPDNSPLRLHLLSSFGLD